MKRRLGALPLIGLCAAAFAGLVQAQSVHVGVGTGLALPMGDYGGVDQAGWRVLGRRYVPIGTSPVSLRIDGLYGRTNHKDGVDGKTNVEGGFADVVWHFPMGVWMVKPYVLAGGGICRVTIAIPSVAYSAAETKFAFGGGAGIGVSAGTVHLFVEGRYVSMRASGGSTDFILVSAGITLGVR